MKLFLAALTIWSLPLLGMSCGSANIQTPEPPRKAESTPTPAGETITLTSQHPTGSFSLQPDLLKNPPAVLEVSLVKVVNPNAKSINVFVYLSPSNDKADNPSDRITVGNFSLYPADRPARFMLDAARAFRKLGETKDAASAKTWQVMFVLQKEAEQESSPVEVTIAAPNWKSDKN